MEGVGAEERVRALHRDPDIPPDARTWIRGRLLELRELPPPSRAWYWFWCRVLKQPLPDFYDLRGTYGSRSEARAHCRDSLDYILSLPYGRDLGSKVAEAPTFCRPLWGPHAEKDREHSARYSEDLSSHFSDINLAACRQMIYELGRMKETRKRLT